MMHADHRKKGVVYGFRPRGLFVSDRLAETGNVYCFRRSTRARLRNASTDKEELDAIHASHMGLNRCETLVLFLATDDIDETWCMLKGRLRHVPFARPETAGGITPKWITQLHEIGDNWFCSDLGPEAFSQWLAAVPLSEEELAQMTMAQISRELEAGAKVQVAGDELLIGPVSSQFAARAVLGLIQTRVERTDYIQKRFKRDPGPGTSN